MAQKFLFVIGILATAVLSETLTVDFADDQGPATYRASGFLGGISTTLPADAYVTPLKPQLFRDGAGYAQVIYSRVKSTGAKAQMCLSLTRNRFYPMPGTNNDWSAWDNHVQTTVNNAKINGQTYEWDIWNEPNATEFWDASISQFNELWRRTVVRIRSIDPNAVIVGPSLNAFDFIWLKNFLQFAKANNVLPTAVCWHEIGGNGTVRGVAANVQVMRTYLAQQEMKIPKIYINEFTSQVSVHNPGMIVRFLAELERAKVDGACKSCWNESDGTNNCYYMLDGIVTSRTHEPRAAWWAYKGYADITGRIAGVKTAPIPFYVDGVAGQDASKGEARAVLGRYANSGALDVKFINLDRTPFLLGTGSIRVLVNRIQNTGEAAMAGPVKVIDSDYPINGNSLLFRIADFPDSNAFTIRLTKGATISIDEVQKSPRNLSVLTVHQNGSQISFALKISRAVADGVAAISVYDLKGRQMKHLRVLPIDGECTAAWDASGQARGLYILALTGENLPVQTKEFLVMN